MLCCQERSGAPERGPSEEYEESAGTNSAWCMGTPRARSTSDSGFSSRAGSRSCGAAPTIHLTFQSFNTGPNIIPIN